MLVWLVLLLLLLLLLLLAPSSAPYANALQQILELGGVRIAPSVGGACQNFLKGFSEVGRAPRIVRSVEQAKKANNQQHNEPQAKLHSTHQPSQTLTINPMPWGCLWYPEGRRGHSGSPATPRAGTDIFKSLHTPIETTAGFLRLRRERPRPWHHLLLLLLILLLQGFQLLGLFLLLSSSRLTRRGRPLDMLMTLYSGERVVVALGDP